VGEHDSELRSLLNPNNQEEEKNPMRPPLWHPPIELSDHEALIIKRIKRAKLFTFLRLNRLFIFNDEFQEELATSLKTAPWVIAQFLRHKLP
jgi:hypothetical protein